MNLPIRVYDNGGRTMDRYTVVYTEPEPLFGETVFSYLGMSGNPSSPNGVGTHGASVGGPVDEPSSRHLGLSINFDSLPEPCRRLVAADLGIPFRNLK